MRSNKSYLIQLHLQSSPEKTAHFRQVDRLFSQSTLTNHIQEKNALPYWSPAPIPNKGSKVSQLLVI